MEDEYHYYRIAYNLRHIHLFSIEGIVPTAFRPLGYPLEIAAVGTLHEGVRFAKLSNLVLWLLCAVLTASITRLFSQLAATLLLILCLFYWVEPYTAGTLFPQVLASTLCLLALWLHFIWRRSGQTIEAVLQGLVWASLILTVPLFFLNVILHLLWLILTKHGPWRTGLIVAIVFVALMSWSVRNKAVFHVWLLSDNSGITLIVGSSEATGSNTGLNIDLKTIVPEVTPQYDELSRDKAYKRAAVDWIRTHPGGAARFYLLKLFSWFNCGTNLHTATTWAAKESSPVGSQHPACSNKGCL